MKSLWDGRCERCGCTFSMTGVDDLSIIDQVRNAHRCPDGGRGVTHATRRIVPGPGPCERLSDRKEY